MSLQFYGQCICESERLSYPEITQAAYNLEIPQLVPSLESYTIKKTILIKLDALNPDSKSLNIEEEGVAMFQDCLNVQTGCRYV